MSGLQGRRRRVEAFKKMVMATAAITCKVGEEEMERSTVQGPFNREGRVLGIDLALRC